ncbi:polyglutamine-binding protein 1-like, partial [Trifolium medium]|nr:polyglutamine-binding protein 1-like [Trifolium medium]
MENFGQDQQQPLPPGVHFFTSNSSPSSHSQTLITSNHFVNATQFNNNIHAAVQDAVLREQELATQNIIRTQREVRNVASPTKDNLDIFSERHDPNALK